MTPKQAMLAVQEAFRHVSRPEMFIYGTCHCDECEEHNQTLSSHTPETITLDALGNSGWDPICAANDQAFRYYLPAMIRLAFGPENYLDQFLFHINWPGRVECLARSEAIAVLDSLWVVASTCEDLADAVDFHGLAAAIQRLEQFLA